MLAIVVAGGVPHADDARWLRDADLVVAADSGASWLDELGVTPNVLVGDLDSVGVDLVDRYAASGVTVERHPGAKDESDAELALGRVIAGGADRVVILGALGGPRVDHELANLLLIADTELVGTGRDVRIVQGSTSVRALHGPAELELEGEPGDLVTLLPVGGDANGVTTRGLRYPLADEALRFVRSRGLSNVVDAAGASVWLESGTLLVVELGQEGDSQ
jgi:thiamine pyrophosphokinase